MDEQVFRGDKIEDVMLSSQGIEEYNSILWFWNGNEINAKDIELVIYNDEEQNNGL